jgi:hypothetical protein
MGAHIYRGTAVLGRDRTGTTRGLATAAKTRRKKMLLTTDGHGSTQSGVDGGSGRFRIGTGERERTETRKEFLL